jgi:hypothetical protein
MIPCSSHVPHFFLRSILTLSESQLRIGTMEEIRIFSVDIEGGLLGFVVCDDSQRISCGLDS